MRWQLLVVILALILIGVVVFRLLMGRTGRRLRPTRLRIAIPQLHPDLVGVRIVVLSDLHVGRMHVPHDRLVAAVREAAPDLLLMGGDYAGRRSARDEALGILRCLSEFAPTFAVMGNTDHDQRFDQRALREIVREGGGELLINDAALARFGEATVEVLGVDDPLHGGGDVGATLAGARGDADVRIALCHSPAVWRELSRLGADLTFFGHTHGGQIRVPGVEALVTHTTYPRELAAGLFRYGGEDRLPVRVAGHWRILRSRRPLTASTAEGTLTYVTRGVGMGMFPVRIFCPPELVIVELIRDDARGDDRQHDG